jgi:hypothetical protein
MESEKCVEDRIAELAAFLDPDAFAEGPDGPLAQRREAAWNEARNRIERSGVRPPAGE